MKNKAMVIPFILALLTGLIRAQSLTQVGFIVKKAVVEGENFVVLCPKAQEKEIIRQAKQAQVVNQRKYHVFPIKKRSDIPRVLPAVLKLKKPVIIIVANSNALSPKSVKYVAEKVGLKGVPVITNRKGDTKQKALLVIRQEDGKIVTHVNKIMAGVLKVTLPGDLIAEAVVDIKKP